MKNCPGIIFSFLGPYTKKYKSALSLIIFHVVQHGILKADLLFRTLEIMFLKII